MKYMERLKGSHINIKNLLLVLVLVVVSVLTRWLPHPTHFTPLLALALFSGALLRSSALMVAFTLATVFFSDLLLGFSEVTPVIYVTLLLLALLGRRFLKSDKFSILTTSSLGFVATIIFFVISNAGVWVLTPMYAKTAKGLWECYVMALPFFHNTLISTVIFTVALHGAWCYLSTPSCEKKPSFKKI